MTKIITYGKNFPLGTSHWQASWYDRERDKWIKDTGGLISKHISEPFTFNTTSGKGDLYLVAGKVELMIPSLVLKEGTYPFNFATESLETPECRLGGEEKSSLFLKIAVGLFVGWAILK